MADDPNQTVANVPAGAGPPPPPPGGPLAPPVIPVPGTPVPVVTGPKHGKGPIVGAVLVLLLGLGAFGLSKGIDGDTEEKYGGEVALLNRWDADPSDATTSLERVTDRTVRALTRFQRAADRNTDAGNDAVDVADRAVDLWNAGDSAGATALANGELTEANDALAQTNQRQLAAFQSLQTAVDDLRRELRRGPR